MMASPKRYKSGFTLIEIITVLLLMSIIAATVLGRSFDTRSTDLSSQMERVRNHFRFAHSMAMKYGDKVWGFRCANVAGSTRYWIFRLDVPVVDPVNDPDLPANQVMLPGESELQVNLSQKKVGMAQFTVFFDRFGRPYDDTYTLLANPLSISIFSPPPDPIMRNFLIIPETGLIQ